jgi:ABC-type transport system involved in multi-copper enzyme maturation permease subunit
MQTLTIISETFRAIRARGMFTALLWISILMVVVLGGFGCDESGWSMLYGLVRIDADYFTADSVWQRSFYLGWLHALLDWWILSFALVLAMFSVSSVFPETLRPGTIDFYLSKSVSRLGLFVGKYLGCLGFMLMQVSIVALGGVLILFIRLGELHLEFLWSIPLALLIFSFVQCINVLFGILTRSSIAALLWTLLFWLFLWIIQKAEFETGAPQTKLVAEAAGMAASMDKTHDYTRTAMTILPKTRETALLLDKLIYEKAPYDLAQTLFLRKTAGSDAAMENSGFLSAAQGGQHTLARSPQYVIGSSLVFELIILLAAYLRFRRMDC